MPLPPISADGLGAYATLLTSPDGAYCDLPEVVEHDEVAGAHGMAILCPKPMAIGPLSVTTMERHPHSAQTFIPLTASHWLVCVAPTRADGTPDAGKARSFLAGPGDAICIHRNVWHAGLTAFDDGAQFAMMMWRATAGDDGVVHTLAKPIELDISGG